VHVDEDDIGLLKAKNVSVAHNPSSNLKLASGIAPVPAMLERGVNVCLGTDGASSNNNLDIFMEMRQAALIHKGASGRPAAVAAAEAFRMATINGAKALGVADKGVGVGVGTSVGVGAGAGVGINTGVSAGAGVIKAGGLADIAIISLDRPHLQPLHNHLSALVYAARASDVETVIADGEILMENRVLTTIDEEKAIYAANRSARKFI
jgi:5-methylthioadenosine/S-adenosylhomocysteine deaminase